MGMSVGPGACYYPVAKLKSLHTFLFIKIYFMKNIEDEMGQKVKNILRICSS